MLAVGIKGIIYGNDKRTGGIPQRTGAEGGSEEHHSAMAAMLMVLIYNLADTLFIGMTHHAYQVAAVSMAIPVFLIFMSVGTVFGIGGTSVISRALGEGKMDYAKKACSFCMWACVAVGVAMSALFLTFMDQIVSVFLTEPEAFDYAAQFDRILLTTSFLFGVFYVLANALQAAGAATAALIINLRRQGFTYIPALFVLKTALGASGLAWAQPVADLLSTALVVFLYIRTVKKMEANSQTQMPSVE